jgi:hypothetical protein
MSDKDKDFLAGSERRAAEFCALDDIGKMQLYRLYKRQGLKKRVHALADEPMPHDGEPDLQPVAQSMPAAPKKKRPSQSLRLMS